MNCETAKNLVQAYLEGRLPVLERNEFVHHVTECGACETEVIAYREVFRALREAPRFDAPERLEIAVLAHLRAEGLVHEPKFSAARRAADGFLALPAKARYPLAALAVVAVLYVPVAIGLGSGGRSVAGLAESFARVVLWVQGAMAGAPGITVFEPYVRAARTVIHAAGGLVSPLALVIAVAAAGALVYSMSRVVRRKRPSGHALFSL
jgi:anti-sigma factor RsiW